MYTIAQSCNCNTMVEGTRGGLGEDVIEPANRDQAPCETTNTDNRLPKSCSAQINPEVLRVHVIHLEFLCRACVRKQVWRKEICRGEEGRITHCGAPYVRRCEI